MPLNLVQSGRDVPDEAKAEFLSCLKRYQAEPDKPQL